MLRGTPDRTLWGGVLAIAAAIGIGRFVYTPILPHMVDALGLTQAQAGLIASANYLGYLVGALLAAAPVFAGRHRSWLLAALAGSAVTTALMAAGSAMPVFLTLRFLGGVASAFAFVFAAAIVMTRPAHPRRPGPAAPHLAGVGTGIALSALLVTGITAAGGGWIWHWTASGLVCLAALVGVVWTLPPSGRTPATPPTVAPADRPSGAPLALIGAYGLFGFGYVITATFLVDLVRTTPAVAAAEAYVWVLVGLAAVPSVDLWSRVARRIGRPRAYSVACLIEAAGVLSSVLWVTPPGVVLAAVLLGGTFVGITALGLASARDAVPHDGAGRVLALMTASFGLGQMVGPTFAGALQDRFGDLLTPSLAAAAALVASAGLAAASGRRPLPSAANR